MNIIIKNITLNDKQSPFNQQIVNIHVINGVFSKISTSPLEDPEAEIFDGSNLHISNGWVDGACHFKDPGYEWLDDLQSLSNAASSGGFTTVIGFPNTNPVVQTKEAISYFTRFNLNNPVQLLNLAAVTRDTKGEDFTDMIDLKKGGAVGFSDGKILLNNPDIFLKTLLYLEPLNGILVVKSEDKYLSMYGQMHEGVTSTLLGMKGIPAAGEEITIMRNLKLLEYSGINSQTPILHFSTISTKESVRLIREAKARGLPVSCDVAAHHLVFSDEELFSFDTNFKVHPPFRSASDIEALIAGLNDDTIDMVVSDHNSWDEEHKNLEFDQAEFGIIGLQTTFSVVLEKLGLEKALEKLVYAPRRIFKLAHEGIKEGVKADCTIFSIDEEYVFLKEMIQSKGKNSPFINRRLTGRSKAIINNRIFVK